MTQHSRGADRLPSLAWSALVIVASAVGGLAAAAINDVAVTIALIVSLLIGVTAAVVSGRLGVVRGGEPGRQAGPGSLTRAPNTEPGFQATPSAGRDYGNERPQPGPGVSSGEPGQRGPHSALRLMQEPPASADSAPWWRKGVTSPAPDAEHRAAPPLSSYLDNALIAQCPRCGWFGIDAEQDQAEWGFRCQACNYRWTWRPGTAWPPVMVRPRLREGRHRAGP